MKRSAVYPGSFDPITNGHVYITERAAAIFDEVRVSVLVNVQKIATFSVEERCAMAREALSHLPNVTVGFFEGLLVDYVRQAQSRVIIRGLRAMSDFEYEFQMALMNRQLAPEIETFFIVTDPKYSYISSSGVREIFQFGGTVQDVVPPGVFRRLRERFPGQTASLRGPEGSAALCRSAMSEQGAVALRRPGQTASDTQEALVPATEHGCARLSPALRGPEGSAALCRSAMSEQGAVALRRPGRPAQ